MTLRYLYSFAGIWLAMLLLALGIVWFMVASYKRKGKRPGA